ncbi:MAG: PQQ-dependent sugar dehydrogenase [Hyphomicrobiaceae bacterium]|nr:PQQ-dependent sugar dehydrogenase [Hyphomicrobiaceae bacterium]
MLVSVGAVLALAAPASAEITSSPRVATKAAVKVETVARGLARPWALQFLAPDRTIVSERGGSLRIVTLAGGISKPLLGVRKVSAEGQGGLLDIALAPDFASSRLLYFSYAEPRDGRRNGTSLARARLVETEDGGRLEGLEVIFRQEPSFASPNHFGSRIVFTDDGSLFLTLGDRYFARDEAQNPANHLGKLVRLAPDGTPYPGNPRLPGWREEIWSIGHRNVQGAALHPVTRRLWIVDHGARGGDEINIPQAGRNYGWPVITYGRDYSGASIGVGTEKEGLEQPVYYWDPSIAPSGAAFYTGDLFPEWKGSLFVGALAGRALHRLVLEGERVVGEEVLLADRGKRIRDVRQGPDGALYLLTDDPDGELLRLSPG